MTKLLTRKSSQIPQARTEYPAGTFIETEKGYFYVVNGTKRYLLVSKRVLDSWRPLRIVTTSEAAVKHLRIAAKMKFRNGSLIHNLADGRIYLIVDSKRCPLVSPEAFERIGAERNSRYIVSVSKDEIELHQPGEEIN